ncbi:hypothetical protein SpCBS45565_g07563 [Spizellomyces sp. 'palustris']|nr:hypothetical protein SpCBS45565_g07563 [Spizellomyces sp. 'palustris']
MALGVGFVSVVDGYGRVGHWMTGWLAQQCLTSEAIEYVRYLLPHHNGNLAKAALWADEIKHGHTYDWADRLHYVNPPKPCTAIPRNSCTQCVVGGIYNYTNRLLSPEYTREEKEEALKFLIHFIGDVHQPLHASGRSAGGTEVKVVFDGRVTSLHEVWDYMLFEKRIKKDFSNSVNTYATHLLTELATTWSPSLPSWARCSLPKTLLLDRSIPSSIPICPEDWATHSALTACEVVWPPYDQHKDNSKWDLGREYYENVIDEAELGALQAGVRIAWIINAIVREVVEDQGGAGREVTAEEVVSWWSGAWSWVRRLVDQSDETDVEVRKIYSAKWR